MTPAQRGTAWGLIEAELMLEAIVNGHRSKPAEWTNGQWSGYLPPGVGRYKYESTLDRAAKAAYDKAITEAQEVL